jgi:hypothetical protein
MLREGQMISALSKSSPDKWRSIDYEFKTGCPILPRPF